MLLSFYTVTGIKSEEAKGYRSLSKLAPKPVLVTAPVRTLTFMHKGVADTPVLIPKSWSIGLLRKFGKNERVAQAFHHEHMV